jgi:serine/threonine protein phosphatase PrpC
VLYGTTLLAVRVRADDVLLAQLGDGDLLLWTDGEGLTVPLPNPETAFPNATDSLVQDDAPANLRVATAPVPDLVLLATDGLEAARGGPGWQESTMQRLHDELASAGPDGIRDVLQRWSDEAAEAGGDDTTLAVLLARTVVADGSAT